MAGTTPALERRLRRKQGLRKRLYGTPDKPRMSVFRSNKHITVQVIDDLNGRTIASAGSVQDKLDVGGNAKGAVEIGRLVGERAKAAGVKAVCFDRNGYKYHGRVKALADAAREAGLQF